MEKNTMIKVTNRSAHLVGYKVPELSVNRQFSRRETKEISFDELEKLSFLPGGKRMLREYLVVKDPEALEALGLKVEPEYFYSKDDVIRILKEGTLDEFLDCLDFAPDGVLDMIKDYAVSLPLDNMSKRDAIQKKLGFNVTKAIEIRNTKFDGGDEVKESTTQTTRRAAAPIVESGRRTAAPKYKVTSIQEQ